MHFVLPAKATVGHIGFRRCVRDFPVNVVVHVASIGRIIVVHRVEVLESIGRIDLLGFSVAHDVETH